MRSRRKSALRTFMEGLMPGRWDGLRPVKPKELKATRLLRLAIDEASAKIRSGPPADDKADLHLAVLGRDHPDRDARRRAAAGRAREGAEPAAAAGREIPPGLKDQALPAFPTYASMTRASTTIGTPPPFTTASSN